MLLPIDHTTLFCNWFFIPHDSGLGWWEVVRLTLCPGDKLLWGILHGNIYSKSISGSQGFCLKSKVTKASLKRQNLSFSNSFLLQEFAIDFLTNNTVCVCMCVFVCFQRVVLQREYALRFTKRIGNMEQTERPS